MKFNYLFLIVLLAGLTGCPSKNTKQTTAQEPVKTQAQSIQHTGTGTLIIKPITFEKDSYVRDAVKKECNLTGKLSQFIEQNASSQYANILTDSKSGQRNAQILTIEIGQVQGGGGGAWSGAKVVTVSGKLTQNGRVLGDFKGRRYSGGGMFGAYKGTCAILGRCVRTLGKDIASWLQNPSSKAVLGDM
jgi:hypothetical protein